MPLYEYECVTHGVFELQRTVAEFATPADCPGCLQPAARILSVPRVALVERGERVGRDRNERSCHEPRVVERSVVPAAGGSPRAWQTAPSGGLPWAIGHG